MPFYQFTVTAGSASASRKAAIASAVTKVHTAVTGAPARYVTVAFTEVPEGSVFAADQPVPHGRLVGIIRAGRSPEVKRELIEGLAQAWSDVTAEPRESFALFLQEIPGSFVMEHGEILHEADQD